MVLGAFSTKCWHNRCLHNTNVCRKLRNRIYYRWIVFLIFLNIFPITSFLSEGAGGLAQSALLRAGQLEFDPGQWWRIFLHIMDSSLALGSTQPPLKWVPYQYFPGDKVGQRLGLAILSPHAMGLEYVNFCIHIPNGSSWSVSRTVLPFFYLI